MQNHKNFSFCLTFSDYLLGQYKVSMVRLLDPPQEYVVRDINRDWSDTLFDSLSCDNTEIVTILPCMVDPSILSDVDQFDCEKLAEYPIFSLGGNHLRVAVKNYLDTGATNLNPDALIDLYVGLPVSDARRLANKHNIKTQTKKADFIDEVKQARRLIYETCGITVEEDPPATLPIGFRKKFLYEIGQSLSHSVCILYLLRSAPVYEHLELTAHNLSIHIIF